MANDARVLLLRSGSDPATPADADARHLRRAGQQHPRGKNKAAWDAALKVSGNRDYTLRILPKANHSQWEAKVGNNAEMASVTRFVPEYFTTIQEWLGKRLPGFDRSR